MSAWALKWRTYGPRTAWYLALLLLAWLAPDYFSGVVRIYLGLALASVAFAFVGVDTTLFWSIRHAEPVPRGFVWVQRFSGVGGAVAALAGLATGGSALFELGMLGVIFGVDLALWSREVRLRSLRHLPGV